MRFQCCEKSFKALPSPPPPPPHGALKKYYNSLSFTISFSFRRDISLLPATPQRRGILTIVLINSESVKLVERDRSIHKIHTDVFFSRIEKKKKKE